jgi:hypothetical protein
VLSSLKRKRKREKERGGAGIHRRKQLAADIDMLQCTPRAMREMVSTVTSQMERKTKDEREDDKQD